MVDYSLAAQVRPPQFADPIQTYAQMQQLQTNMLAAQRLRQQVQSENQLRNLFQGGKFDLESPELASRIGAIDPDMAFKVLQAQRQAKLTERQTAKANAELIVAQGDVFRQALGRVDSFPAEERANVYTRLRDSLPDDIKRLYPAQYSPDVVRRGMMTTDQLIASAKEVEPKYQQLPGNLPGEYVPGQGVRVLPMLPTPSGIPVGRGGGADQAGVPSYPVSAGRQAAMSAAAQRYAPELVGAAPAPAPAPASVTPQPAPPTNAMLQQPMTVEELAARARALDVEQEASKITARKQAEARVERQEARPKVQTAYVSTVEKLDRQIRNIDELLQRGGSLDWAVGPLAGRSFSPTGLIGSVQGAQARIDQIKAQAGLSALLELKESSPTGSAVGSVSNEEGRRLEASVVAASQLQNPEEFRKAMADLRGDLQRAKTRIADAYKRDYGEDAPSTAQPARGGLQRLNDTTVTAGGATYRFPTKDAADAFFKRASQ